MGGREPPSKKESAMHSPSIGRLLIVSGWKCSPLCNNCKQYFIISSRLHIQNIFVLPLWQEEGGGVVVKLVQFFSELAS